MDKIKVFKFGGASVKDADSVKNVESIIKTFPQQKLMVVVSAMGKTTNALENICLAAFHHRSNLEMLLNELKNYHYAIFDKLFSSPVPEIKAELNILFDELSNTLQSPTYDAYDYFYDQIVGFGELLSTRLMALYLSYSGISCVFIDVRDYLRTDNNYRDAAVDWEQSQHLINSLMKPLFNDYQVIVTQGFIGKTDEGKTTTLGREGSDFTGAIFAYALDAESLTIWKDVPGFLNADPKIFTETKKLDQISYAETIELSYYGASIIHPKTIKPLENKKIPLFVKSFLKPNEKGSIIQSDKNFDGLIPSIIVKQNQVLISISARDFSFIAERNLALIFTKLAFYGIKVNLMQNSAISFSICVDKNEERIARFILDLKDDFRVKYNENLELLTLRHYTEDLMGALFEGKKILLEQRSRVTVQVVART